MSAILGLTRTLALIKPHAVRHRFAILRRIRMSGFHVLQERCVKLTGEQATAFLCRELSGCDICMEVVELSSGPAIVLCLSRDNAVEKWKELMGPEKCLVARQSSPTCLRALYGDRDDDTKNAVYGSETDDVVTLQLHFFFPNMVLEPTPGKEWTENYLCSVLYQPLMDGLHELNKAKPDDQLEWLANFMLQRNTNKPAIFEADAETMQHLKEMKKKQEETSNDRPSSS